MPLGFGHLIGGWIAGKVYCKISGNKLSMLAWSALLLGANLPDVDYFIDWTTCFKIHRYFSHSIAFALSAGAVLCVGLLLFNLLFKKNKVDKIFIVGIMLALGILVHIGLDLLFTTSGMRILWPIEQRWWTINGAVEHITEPPTYEMLKQDLREAIMDIALGVAWVWYFFLRKKLSF